MLNKKQLLSLAIRKKTKLKTEWDWDWEATLKSSEDAQLIFCARMKTITKAIFEVRRTNFISNRGPCRNSRSKKNSFTKRSSEDFSGACNAIAKSLL